MVIQLSARHDSEIIAFGGEIVTKNRRTTK